MHNKQGHTFGFLHMHVAGNFEIFEEEFLW
mgnify:CR=1 FL=1